MLNKIRVLLVAGVMSVASMASAGVAEDISAGLDADVVLWNAINEGQTIYDAVAAAVAAAPDRAGEFVSAAFYLLPAASSSVCGNLDLDSHGSDKSIVGGASNKAGCGAAIVQAAINAGGDPAAVAEAANQAHALGLVKDDATTSSGSANASRS